MDDSCIFCKITSGEIPCHKLYEDERVFAFLDLGPLSAGHALVVPKAHAVTLGQLPDEDAAAVGKVLPRISRAIAEATGCEAYNVLVNNGKPAGQLVTHVHFHIIPKPADAPHAGGKQGSGLGVGWPASDLDHVAAEALAQKIARAM